MRIIRAFGNMLRAALRNPLWAIISLTLAPFRAIKYLILVGMPAIGVWLVFGIPAELLLKHFGYTSHDWLYRGIFYIIIAPPRLSSSA